MERIWKNSSFFLSTDTILSEHFSRATLSAAESSSCWMLGERTITLIRESVDNFNKKLFISF